MLLLVTTGHPDMERYAHPNLGRLVQPRHYSSIEATARVGIPWAADNDAYNSFDPDAYLTMLRRLRGLSGCLFVACPDVLGDATATRELFDLWGGDLEGLPIGYIAQDGQVSERVPWADIAALFIGGTTEFKLGPDAERLMAEAKDRGKWLHVGRVNTLRRLRYCATHHADSVDGTKWAMWKNVYLTGGLTAVMQPRQPRLGEVT